LIHNGSFKVEEIEENEVQKHCSVLQAIMEEQAVRQDQMINIPFASTYFLKIKKATEFSSVFGPSNVRLRMLLLLRGQALVSNGGESRNLAEGDLLIGDDSYLNKLRLLATVRSEGGTRQEALLFVADFWHPGLTIEERKCIFECLSNLP